MFNSITDTCWTDIFFIPVVYRLSVLIFIFFIINEAGGDTVDERIELSPQPQTSVVARVIFTSLSAGA